MQRQNRRALYGGVLILVIVVLGTLIFFMGDIIQALRGPTRIVALLDGARDVRAGTPVLVAGIEVGRVEHVELLPASGDSAPLVAVVLDIPEAALDLVRRDSRVELTTARFVGQSVIDVHPGSARGEPIATGDTLLSRHGPGIERLMEQQRALRASLDTLVEIGSSLSGPAERARDRLDQLDSRLGAARAELATLANTLEDGPAARFMRDPALTRALAGLRATAAALETAMDSTGERATPADVTAAVHRLGAHAAQLMAQIDRIGAANGSLARFAGDSALLHAIHTTRTQLDSLIAEARAHPFRFVF